MFFRLIFLVGIFVSACATVVPAQEILRLQELPTGDRWFGVFMTGERVGFALGNTSRTPDGYRFSGVGAEKMTGMFARESVLHERYSAGNDLAVSSFSVLQNLNGVQAETSGEETPAGLRVVYVSKGVKKEKVLKHSGPVFPPIALNLLPLLRGASAGKSFKVQIIEPEDRKLKNVRVTVVGTEGDGAKRLVHLRHNRYPFATDVWVDPAGNTIKEAVRDDWIVTSWEDETTALRNLSEAAVAKRSFIEAYSRIIVQPGITDPAGLKKLVVELSGLPPSFESAPGFFQTSRKTDDGKTVLTLDRDRGSANASPEEVPKNSLGASGLIQPGDPAVLEKLSAITEGEKDRRRVVEKLVGWVSRNLQETQTETVSPGETLQAGGGNAQSKTLLYISLARAAGIPTRYVAGLVFVPGKGFFYHSWAESHVGRWTPVDPVIGQVPADLTHLFLVEGYTVDSQVLLGRLVGKLKAGILEQVY